VTEQPEEQRREQAAQRRRQEQQAAIDAAVAAERDRTGKELADFFAGARLTNTITGAPITNMDEFHTWRMAYEAAQLQTDLQAGKLTPESLNKAIAGNPVIKQAEEVIRRGAEEQRRQELAAMQARVDAEIAEIGKLDPAIKSVGDLMAMPNAPQFYEYVKRGNSFTDAFYLANRDKLAASAAAAAKQKALNDARSKDHLTPPAARGSGALSVPPDEMALFKLLNPKATDAEIQSYYNKSKSGG
jgi:hypothetical protein